jgi:hypothetical protein
MGIVISKQPSLLTYGFGDTVDYVDQLEFKASHVDTSKEWAAKTLNLSKL